MLYPYIKFPDGTEVAHSQITDSKIEVHFERPVENGFDSARCELPEYKWLFIEGYSADEITEFEEFLRHNAHLLYKYAETGGCGCA